MQEHQQVLQEDLMDRIQLLPEQQPLVVEVVLQQVDPLVMMVPLEDQVVEQLETVELVELQQLVKEMQVEIQMHLLEKVEQVVAELEPQVAQVEMQQELQVEQEVLPHHYHHAHLQVVVEVVQIVQEIQVEPEVQVVVELEEEDHLVELQQVNQEQLIPVAVAELVVEMVELEDQVDLAVR